MKLLAAIEQFRYNPVPAVCRVEAWKDNTGKYHIFLTELKENRGMSVTNAIEHLAPKALRWLRKVHPDAVTVRGEEIVWHDCVERSGDQPPGHYLVFLHWEDDQTTKKPEWKSEPDPRNPHPIALNKTG